MENFIGDALQQPPSYIAYCVSRELAERYPHRAIIEGEDGDFDLPAFVKAGQCALVHEPRVHAQAKASWDGIKRQIELEPQNAWMNVLWCGHMVDVLRITWDSGGCETAYHWILADTHEIAAAFYESVCQWTSEVRGEILVFERGHWRKDEALYKAIAGATFDTLILPEPLEIEVRRDLERFLASRDVYERYGVPWKRGVLLTGPPGNGKTHAIKALANTLGIPCLYVRSFVSKYGTVQGNIREVFHRARRTTPCLLVLEDLDSLVDDKSRAFFLNELDGFGSNAGVIVLATTNHPERLDPAIVDRPSRFDRKFRFPLPAALERERYIRQWNETVQEELRLSEVGIAEAVAATEGFSFAYLKELFLSSIMVWIQEPTRGRMDGVMSRRAELLRAQMAENRLPSPEPPREDDEDDEDD